MTILAGSHSRHRASAARHQAKEPRQRTIVAEHFDPWLSRWVDRRSIAFYSLVCKPNLVLLAFGPPFNDCPSRMSAQDLSGVIPTAEEQQTGALRFG
jgi:hypothetical protein